MKGVRNVRPIFEGREALQVKLLRRTPAPSCRELGPELERRHHVASKKREHANTHTKRKRAGQENEKSKLLNKPQNKSTSRFGFGQNAYDACLLTLLYSGGIVMVVEGFVYPKDRSAERSLSCCRHSSGCSCLLYTSPSPRD